MTPIISLELVIEIHDNVIDISGGANGVNIAVAIAKGHGFTDGNKRTALSTMLTFLDIQGITLIENTGLDDIMVDVVESQLSHDVLVKKLAYYIRFLVKNN